MVKLIEMPWNCWMRCWSFRYFFFPGDFCSLVKQPWGFHNLHFWGVIISPILLGLKNHHNPSFSIVLGSKGMFNKWLSPPGNDHISPEPRHYNMKMMIFLFRLVGYVIVSWRVSMVWVSINDINGCFLSIIYWVSNLKKTSAECWDTQKTTIDWTIQRFCEGNIAW